MHLDVGSRVSGKKRRRVVIVGGGIAGLTTAYELTRTAAHRAQWDVEVVEMGHQMGGRLGSAHHPETYGRNQEHGLHIWFGWYDNTMRLADDVWRQWDRPADCPWRTIWDGLDPIWASDHGIGPADDLQLRRFHHARNNAAPGVDEHRMGLGRAVGWLDTLRSLPKTLLSISKPQEPRVPDAPPAHWSSPGAANVLREVDRMLRPVFALLGRGRRKMSPERRVRLGGRAHKLLARAHGPVVRRALALADGQLGAVELGHAVDLAIAIARGLTCPTHAILADGDLDRVSSWELRQWLAHHGAASDTLAQSRLVECLYDIPFAFRDGDRSQPVLEASTALRFTYRLLAGYKHAPAWRLTAGAGETIVAPLYDLLVERGVRFRPFHRLQSIDTGGGETTSLTFVRAARVRGTYDPLITRNGMRGFRAAPDWDQLVEGDHLRARGVDFYSRFGDRGETEAVTMRIDEDFDDVVLALPLGCIAPNADGHSPVEHWLAQYAPARRCLDKLHLVPTVAAQVWFAASADTIGLKKRSVVTWGVPYSVVCDMSEVVAHEAWPQPAPQSCAYLCGAWPMTTPGSASSAKGALAEDNREARRLLHQQLERQGGTLLASAAPYIPPGSDDASAAYYVRANVQPWDLADLALPGADAVRLEASQTGTRNMALAGSWVRTAVNSTSVEAAVSSGVAAARALGAQTQPLLSEALFRKPSRQPFLPGRAPGWIDDARHSAAPDIEPVPHRRTA